MKDEFKMKLKKIGIIALIVSILSLIIGASFHGYRMHQRMFKPIILVLQWELRWQVLQEYHLSFFSLCY